MAKSARQTKDEACAAYIGVIRPLDSRFLAFPQASDAERASFSISVRQKPAPIGPPTAAPYCSIECCNRLQQTLRFVESATPTRKAKPAEFSILKPSLRGLRRTPRSLSPYRP